MLPLHLRLSSFQYRKLKKRGQVTPGRLFLVSYLMPSKREEPDFRLEFPRFGFIVGSFLSKKASQRNLVRRRLSESVRLFVAGHVDQLRGSRLDVCFIARSPILRSNYGEIDSEVNKVLSKIFEL